MRRAATVLALILPGAAGADATYICDMRLMCINTDPCMPFEAIAVYELDGSLGPGDGGSGRWTVDDGATSNPITYEVDHDGGLLIEYRAADGSSTSRLMTMVDGGLGVDTTHVATTGFSATLQGRCRRE